MRSCIGILLCWAACAAAQPVILRSPQLEVTLERETGLPAQFRLVSGGAVIHGAEPGHAVTATLFQAEGHQFQTVTLQPRSVKPAATRADFAFQAASGGHPAASFTLRYELRGAAVFVSVEDIREQPGYELIDVGTPDLASVREEDGGAWLAHGETGGNLIQLSAAKPGKLAPNRFWFGVAATLPVVMIGTSKALCVQEVIAFMDSTELAVEGENGHRRAELGTVSAHRVNGSLAWDMNAEPGKPRIAGNDKTPNLLIEQRPFARLDFAGDFDGNGAVDWLDGAKIVRDRMPPIPSHYYDDRLPYNLHIDEPRWPAPRMTFEQAGKLVGQVAMLTAYAPQDVYLWGWQFRGKDSGYPAVNEMNARAGGRTGLLKLMADGRAVNANVSFSDNYDDAYKSSPAWDTNYIARQPDDELWESRNWTGETSYILGMAKYMAGPGTERVRYTCKEYPLKNTYLIDVLSYYPIRNDWDPAHPASGIKNLTEGRYKVLDEFKKCGLDIVSEQMRYAFIGKNSVNDNGPTGGPSPFGGDGSTINPIPLAATIYRHSAIWGLSGQEWRKSPEIFTLFYNGHEFFGGPETPEHLAEFYYSEMVPWFQAHYRKVESYRREGDRTRIGLEGNSSIDIDWKNLRYTLAINGAEVAKDGDTFCPVGDDRVAFYSKKGGRLSAPLPKGWDPAKMAALALFTDHAEEAKFSLADDKVSVDAPAARPIVLFRDGAAARTKMHAGAAR
jgi:hypothetical protein